MLRTIEAEVMEDGTIIPLEAIDVKRTTRALVTLIENGSTQGNAGDVQRLMKSNSFQNRRAYTAQQIEQQIDEERNGWE